MIVAAWAAPAPAPNPGTYYTSDVYPLATAYSALGAPGAAYYSAPTYYASASPYYNSYNSYAYRAPYYAYSSSVLL